MTKQSPDYAIVVRETVNGTTDMSPGAIIDEYHNATNIGYSEIVGNIPQMFFSLSQDDVDARSTAIFNSSLYYKPYHFTVYRNGENVWSGWGPLEVDERKDDLIAYSYGYAAGLYWTLTGFKETYTSKKLATEIITTMLTAAKAKSKSMLSWLTNGTLEDPTTTSGGATPITLPYYIANYKRLLFVMREMAAYAASDTTNRVWFEVTPAGVINFWKNAGSTLYTPAFRYPKGNVLNFSRYRMPVDLRTKLYGVGTSPTDVALQSTQEDTSASSSYGLREDSIYLQWVRDSDELARTTKHRLQIAKREDQQLTLTLAPNEVAPIRATGGLQMMADYPIYITKGSIQINKRKMLIGNQVIFTGGREYVRPIFQDVPI